MKEIGLRYDKLTFKYTGTLAALQLRQHPAQARTRPLTPHGLHVFILDTVLIGGLRFVFDKIAAAVDTELNDDTHLREELLAAQMRLDLGEMSQAEFDTFEADILPRLRRDSREPPGRRTGGPLAHRVQDHGHRCHVRRRRARS